MRISLTFVFLRIRIFQFLLFADTFVFPRMPFPFQKPLKEGHAPWGFDFLYVTVPLACSRVTTVACCRVDSSSPALRNDPKSTRNRSRAPTAAHQVSRISPQTRTYPRPTGSRSTAPTAAHRGARPSPPSCT